MATGRLYKKKIETMVTKEVPDLVTLTLSLEEATALRTVLGMIKIDSPIGKRTYEIFKELFKMNIQKCGPYVQSCLNVSHVTEEDIQKTVDDMVGRDCTEEVPF